jgi:glycosyltransferase involved in cell wall biosynthesis
MKSGSFEDKTTLIFATIGRPDCVKRLVTSVRSFYPKLKIVVADQNGFNKTIDKFYKENSVHAVYLSDVGVGAARNAAVSKINTDYILVADDDFIFAKFTDLSLPYIILENDKNIDIIGGLIIDIPSKTGNSNHCYIRRWERVFSNNPENSLLIGVQLDDLLPTQKQVNGISYYMCDAVLNWAVMRKAAFTKGARWDDRFRCNGEHEDFYLNIKHNTKLKVAYCPAFQCAHHNPMPSVYSTLRNEEEGWILFGKKWGITRYADFGGTGLRSLETGKTILSSFEDGVAKSRVVDMSNRVLAKVNDRGEIDISAELPENLKYIVTATVNESQSVLVKCESNSPNKKIMKKAKKLLRKISKKYSAKSRIV